jgi:predicted nucleotide-binding protein (sugar kinase/HSP70/actin superfamily)
MDSADFLETFDTTDTADTAMVDTVNHSQLTIGLLGHGYTIYDDYISRQTICKLRELGVRVVTQDLLSEEAIEEGAQQLPKRMFWSLGKQILGGAYHFFDNHNVDGIVHFACFGCGPDSLVAELVEIEAHRRKDLPFMMLTVDEHTGEAGIITRLEAFIDMIQRQKKRRLADGQRMTG